MLIGNVFVYLIMILNKFLSITCLMLVYSFVGFFGGFFLQYFYLFTVFFLLHCLFYFIYLFISIICLFTFFTICKTFVVYFLSMIFPRRRRKIFILVKIQNKNRSTCVSSQISIIFSKVRSKIPKDNSVSM